MRCSICGKSANPNLKISDEPVCTKCFSEEMIKHARQKEKDFEEKYFHQGHA